MNSFERIVAALNLDTPDRVPIAPWAEAPVCKYLGVQLKNGLVHGESMANIQSEAYTRFQYDVISIGHGLAGIQPEALGCQVSFPTDDFARIVEVAVKSPQDADKLTVPDPKMDGLLPQYFAGISQLKTKLPEGVPLCLLLYSPFAIAARIRGVHRILLDVYDNPQLVHTLMEICTESQLLIGKAALDAGVEMLFFGADMEGPLMFSPVHYDEFCKEENEALLGELLGKGAYVLYHMCGRLRQTGLIDRILATGVQAVGPGQLSADDIVDIAPLKAEYGNRISIFGNLNPIGKLLKGTPDETEEEVYEIMAKGKEKGGFVFHTGGTMSPETPLENFTSMLRAAERAGRYE